MTLSTTDITQCDDCSLDKTKRVEGSGKKKEPPIAFVGEAPGAQEVEEGRPFVGMAGQVIRRVINQVGLSDRSVYFTNACLCRPPSNRTPTASEIKCCNKRLLRELESINPQYVVALGATAGKAVFPDYKSLKKERGVYRQSATGHTGFVTYHPAAVLYPKGDSIFPFLMNDIRKLVLKLEGKDLNEYCQKDTGVTIVTEDNAEEFIHGLNEALLQGVPVSYDWETTGPDSRVDVGYCLGVSWEVGRAYTIPAHVIRNYKPISKMWEAVAGNKQLSAFNAPFDMMFNRRMGLAGHTYYDPMLMHALLDEKPQQRSLENLSYDYCDADRYESEMLAKYNCSKGEMIEKIPPEVIYEYCGKDADYGLRLTLILKDELSKFTKLQNLYDKLIVPAFHALPEIQHKGLWVDRESLEETTEVYEKKLADALSQIKEITGNDKFNPNSHPQVQAFLWDTLELSEPDIYGRKPRSADKDTRKALLEVYPEQGFVKALDDYKEVYTLLSRYLRPLPKYIQSDGRVRCQFHMDRTETGRLSTTDPAIHQIPRESSVRSVFAAPPRHKLIQADYKQVEIRMAAHIASDRKLTDLLKAGVDFHTKMASEAFRVPVEEVTKEQRQAAKMVSFGLLYLMGDKKLADSTGLPPKEALRFVREYKKPMPNVQAWIELTKGKVRSQGYVESVFGRRRRFPLITRQNLAGLQREAVNMPIQSSASDLTLWSLVKLHVALKDRYPEAHIVMMVHDSLIIECPDPLITEVSKLTKDIMTTPPFETEVPFDVEIKAGQLWGEGEILDV